MQDVIFGFFAALALVCAAGVVLSRSAVNAAMCLLLSLAGIAALFIRLDAFLLAFLLILVYAGAVVALFLFIIMLLDEKKGAAPASAGRASAVAVAGALVLAGLVSFIAKENLAPPPPAAVPAVGASLDGYAYLLFTVYLLPVEVIGFLLLIAMLGVIALSRRASE